MKKLILGLLFFCFCVLTLSAQTLTVAINLTDIRLQAAPYYTNRTLWINSRSVPNANSPSVVLGATIIGGTDTNGLYYFSNAQQYVYQVTVRASPYGGQQELFAFMPTTADITSGGLINAADRLVAYSTATFPAGSVAWAAAVTDGRYIQQLTSSNGTVVFYPSTGKPLNGKIDIAVIGGGGGGPTNGILILNGFGTNTTLYGPFFYDSQPLNFTNVNDVFNGNGAGLVGILGSSINGSVGSANVAASLSTVITPVNMTPTLQLLNTNNGNGLTNLNAANLVGGPVPLGPLTAATASNLTINASGTSGLSFVMSPTANKFTFDVSSGILRLTNSVFNDWAQWNGGFTIGNGSTSLIDLWGGGGSGPGNMDISGVFSGNVAGATNYTKNSATQDGIVTAGTNGAVNAFWSLDINHVPAWRAFTPASPTFDQLGSGTNITANMGVGSGAIIQPSGSGQIISTFAQSVNANTVVGGAVGGQLNQNTIATNTAFDGAVAVATGNTFKYVASTNANLLANYNTVWLDSTNGSDSNSGLNANQPVKSPYQARVVAGAASTNWSFRFNPGIYDISQTGPFLLNEGDKVFGWGATIYNTNTAAGLGSNVMVYVNGSCEIRGLKIAGNTNTTAIQLPIYLNPTNTTRNLNVYLDGLRITNYSDGIYSVSIPNATQTIKLIVNNCDIETSWDCVNINNLAQVATCEFWLRDCRIISKYYTNGGSTTLRGVVCGPGTWRVDNCHIETVGLTNVGSSSEMGINIASGIGGTLPSIYVNGTSIELDPIAYNTNITTRFAIQWTAFGPGCFVYGHPYNDYDVAGKLFWIGDVTNAASVGAFISSDSNSNRYWSFNASLFTNLNASALASGTIPIGVEANQVQQLRTNYMGGVTNIGGQFATNAVQGIVSAGASTNNHVITLPGIVSTNWYHNTNVDLVGSGDFALKVVDGLSVSNLGGAWIYMTNGCQTFTNPTVAAAPAIVLCNGSITIYNGTNLTVVSNLIVQGWIQLGGNVTNTSWGAGVIESDANGKVSPFAYLAPLLMGTNTYVAAGANVTVTTNYSGGVLTYTVAASGAGAAWLLAGNAGTVEASSFLGTTDGKRLHIRVNNIESGLIDATNVVFGSQQTLLTPAAVSAANANVISGGNQNIISNSVSGSDTIAGGTFNTIYSSGADNTILGGIGNNITNAGSESTIAGGNQNVIGGAGSDFGAFVAGGVSNWCNAANTFAAGSQAWSTNAGAFVWADPTGPFWSTNNNSFNVRATGGVRFITSGGVTKFDSSIRTLSSISAAVSYITNNTYPLPQAWAGPTNYLTATNGLQTFTAVSDMQITNYDSVSAAVPSLTILWITNSVATNCALRLPLTGNNVSSFLCPASSISVIAFLIGSSTNAWSLTSTNIAWASNLAAGAIIGSSDGSALWNVRVSAANLASNTIPVGVYQSQLAQLTTNFLALTITNTLGQIIDNALQGVIVGQGMVGSTNNNVMTLNLNGPLQSLSTNNGSGISNVLSTAGLTYYVSPTAGSSVNSGLSPDAPWTLSYAITNVGPSNQIRLLDGQYAGPPTGFPWALQNSYVSIVAQNKFRAQITNAPSLVFDVLSTTYAVNGIEIGGILFTNAGSEPILINSGSNFWVHDCVIQNTRASVHDGSQSASGIVGIGLLNSTFERILSEYNGTNSTVVGANHGFYFSGTNITIRECVSRYNQGYGYQLFDSTRSIRGLLMYADVGYQDVGDVNGVTELLIDPKDATSLSNYIWNCTFITTNKFAIQLQSSGNAGFTNNIIYSSGTNAFYPSGSVTEGYNLGNHTMGGGAGDVITANPGLVSTNTGLYWLLPSSAARGIANSTTFGAVDFFGRPQASVLDAGAFQYAVALQSDNRVLDPSPSVGVLNGPDYWFYPSQLASAPLSLLGTNYFSGSGTNQFGNGVLFSSSTATNNGGALTNVSNATATNTTVGATINTANGANLTNTPPSGVLASNTFPITASFANLANSGVILWNSNGTALYVVGTNTPGAVAYTNEIWPQIQATSLTGTVPYGSLPPAALTNFDTRSPVFNAGGLTNLMATNLYGGIWSFEMTADGIDPSQVGTSMTYLTNTPSLNSTNTQGAGPAFTAWGSSVSASNQVMFRFKLPYDYDTGKVNFSLGITGGTNNSNHKVIVAAVAAAVINTALPAFTVVTNNLPVQTTAWQQSLRLTGLTIAGSPTPRQDCYALLAIDAGSAGSTFTNNILLLSVSVDGTKTNAIQGSLTPP